jgi:hypothetical protein
VQIGGTQMGIGTAILSALGRDLDSQYRREFEGLARAVFAQAPIATVEHLADMFSHGGFIEGLVMQGVSRRDAEGGAQELEFEMRQMFRSAKVDGPGSPSDRSVRTVATKVASATAKRGPIVFVAGWSEVFKEVQKGKILHSGRDFMQFSEECTLKAISRCQYLQRKYAEMG